MKTKSFLSTVVLGLVLVVWAATPVFGGKDSFIVAYATKFSIFDPYQNTQREVLNTSYLIFDPLIERDPDDASLHPHLAVSWKVIDPTTWEFKLRPGVKFHNGNPLTAECVRFTLEERILDPKQKSPQRGHFKWIKKVEVVDNLTFRIITEKPYPLALERFNTLFIYDPNHIREKGDKYWEHPIGTGPYKFVKMAEDGTKLELMANENYWKKGVPKIKNLTIRAIPEQTTRVAELITGGVNAAANLTPDQVSFLEKNPRVKALEVPILRINFWQFDSSGRASKTPLMDVRVRRAIWHAIDKEKIVKAVLGKHAQPLNSPLNPWHFGYDPSIKGYEYNPERAKALLKEAGYEKGFEIDVWQYFDYQNDINLAAMGYLAKVGIKLNIKDYRGNVPQLLTLRHAGKITGIGNYAWGSYNIFDADAILPAWFVSAEPRSYTRDQKLEEWLMEARFSVDQAIRKEIYKKAHKRIIEQAYWMPWNVVTSIHGLDKKLSYKVGRDEVPRLQYAQWLE